MIFSNRQMFFEQWEHQDYLDNYVYIHMYNIYEHSTLECSFINIIFDEKQQLIKTCLFLFSIIQKMIKEVLSHVNHPPYVSVVNG